MTERTVAVIEGLFGKAERGVVADLLERVRFAVLKISNGDIGELREAVRHAQIDWRDVLVAAGFGERLAHREWAEAL